MAKLPIRADKLRLLILVVAYDAENNIASLLKRVPRELTEWYHVEVLVLDDSSQDRTFEISRDVQQQGSIPFPLHVLFNPVNQGYGGNQKIGYHFAIQRDFDHVALLHGDGQYAPECLPDLLRPLRDGEADAVFGSRMLEPKAALRGGMPLYKYVGNKILTWLENRLLGTSLSEFHSGYRIYSVAALKRVPFVLNTNDFHFDTEIIVQVVIAGLRIKEVAIPTYYGDEICHVNGLKYAFDVIRSVFLARCQRLGLFYDRRFDCALAESGNVRYQGKLDFPSSHSVVLETIPDGARVIDVGCAGGYVGAALRTRRHCRVTGVDRHPLPSGIELDAFLLHDLNDGLPPIDVSHCDYVLLLDVIEHLVSPEAMIDQLRRALELSPSTKILVSTANIGFFVTRVMLLFGQFNYGKRGILDLTHTRLFTFASFRRLFEQGGFRILDLHGVPAPWPFVFGNSVLSRVAMTLNRLFIRVAPGLFSYQIFMTVQPLPSLEYLLRAAHEESALRGAAMNQEPQASDHASA